MKKRLMSLLLAVLLAACLLSPVLAKEVDSGTCGDGVTWSLDGDGVLTIGGAGEISDNPGYLSRYGLKITSVVISDGITKIGERAFAECSYLAEVTMPDSVTAIGKYAFQNCQRLTSVTMSAALTSIGMGAFFNCKRLPSIEIPRGVTSIGEGAFFGCRKLTDVHYDGTEKEWTAIDIGEDNYNLYRVELVPTGAAAVAEQAAGAPARSYDPDVAVFGEGVAWTDAVPFIDESNRMLTPLRAVGEALGLAVDWDREAREAIFSDGEKTLYFPIGSRTARSGGGETLEMDTAAVIVEGRTYAPVRYLAEFFGFTVTWDAPSRTARIS